MTCERETEMERMVLLRSLFRSAAFRSCRFSAVVNHHQQLRHYASSRSLFNLFAPTAIASRQALPSGTFFSKCSSLIAVDRKKKYSEKWTWIETFDFFFSYFFFLFCFDRCESVCFKIKFSNDSEVKP